MNTYIYIDYYLTSKYIRWSTPQVPSSERSDLRRYRRDAQMGRRTHYYFIILGRSDTFCCCGRRVPGRPETLGRASSRDGLDGAGAMAPTGRSSAPKCGTPARGLPARRRARPPAPAVPTTWPACARARAAQIAALATLFPLPRARPQRASGTDQQNARGRPQARS